MHCERTAMSETSESRSSPPEKQHGHPSKPHKHILELMQNGHARADTTPDVLKLPDIADSETVKLAAPASNGKTARSANSVSLNGHEDIDEIETVKVTAVPSNEREGVTETETVKLHAAPGAASKAQGRRAQLSQQILTRAVYPLRQLNRLRHYSPPLFALALLVPLIALLLGSTLEYVQLQQPFNNLYMVNALSGAASGQLSVTTPVQPLAADDQGSLLSLTTSQHLQQLAAYSLSGALQWRGLTTPYTFSIPAPSSHPGSVLVAAGAQLVATSGDRIAPLRPLMLYQVRRATGAVIWQMALARTSDQDAAAILGADQHAVYIAIVQTGPRASTSRPVVALQAISQANGAVIWSVAGPTAANDAFQDVGHLLLSNGTAFWQVAGSIYAINIARGLVQWSHLIPEIADQELLAEESHMLVADNTLIIERAILYHAFDVSNGNEIWNVSNPGQEYSGQPGNSGIAAAGNTLLLYGGGQIVALDAATRQVLWTQKQLDSVQSIVISSNGGLAYVNLTDSVEGSQPTQALVALDIQNGGARWTFQPSDQISFLPLLQGGFVYSGHVLLTAICLSQQTICAQPLLYALNPLTGAILWKVGGNSISAITVGPTGDELVFQRQSTSWLDLTLRFKS
jgi:outer membrane protein assembly factor BamB